MKVTITLKTILDALRTNFLIKFEIKLHGKKYEMIKSSGKKPTRCFLRIQFVKAATFNPTLYGIQLCILYMGWDGFHV